MQEGETFNNPEVTSRMQEKLGRAPILGIYYRGIFPQSKLQSVFSSSGMEAEMFSRSGDFARFSESVNPDLLVTSMADYLEVTQLESEKGVNTPILALSESRGNVLSFGINDKDSQIRTLDDFCHVRNNDMEIILRAQKLIGENIPTKPSLVYVSGLVIDLVNKRITRGEESVTFGRVEWKMLDLLATSIGQRVVHGEEIRAKTWGLYAENAGVALVRKHMELIREGIGSDKIETVHGVGFRLKMPDKVEW